MCCRNVDWDNALAYDSVKVIRIKDKWLGLMRMILVALILLYIVLKVVIIDKSYYIHDSPSGSTRISLQMPKEIDMRTEDFCPNNPKYIVSCQKEPTSSWAYKNETCLDKPSSLQGLPIACQVWDEHNARYPADELNAIFITTRVISDEQVYHCGKQNTNHDPTIEDPVCSSPYKSDGDKQGVFFLAGIKSYTLGIQHTFFGQSSPFQSDIYRGNSREFYGKIYTNPDDKKNSLVEFPALKNSDVPDILTVGQLLDAGKIDLSNESKDPDNSLYYSGTVILVLVKYTNDAGIFHPTPTDPRYEYIVHRVKDSDYKLFETKTTSDPNRRLLIKRAGPKFIFLVTGDFAQFSPQTLILQCASAVGLLGVATLVVEFIMLKIMRYRKHYESAKFEQTQNFSQLYNDGVDSDDMLTNSTDGAYAPNDYGSGNGNGGTQYSKF